MLFIALIATIAVASAGSSIDISWKDCGSSKDEGNISTIVFDPPSPEKTNSNWTATVKGSVKEQITNGTFDAKVTLFGIKVDEIKGLLCKPKTVMLPDNYGYIIYKGIQCPLAAGSVQFQLLANLSSNAPDDKVVVTLNTYDQNKSVIICAELELKINRKDNVQGYKVYQ